MCPIMTILGISVARFNSETRDARHDQDPGEYYHWPLPRPSVRPGLSFLSDRTLRRLECHRALEPDLGQELQLNT